MTCKLYLSELLFKSHISQTSNSAKGPVLEKLPTIWECIDTRTRKGVNALLPEVIFWIFSAFHLNCS